MNRINATITEVRTRRTRAGTPYHALKLELDDGRTVWHNVITPDARPPAGEYGRAARERIDRARRGRRISVEVRPATWPGAVNVLEVVGFYPPVERWRVVAGTALEVCGEALVRAGEALRCP